MYSFLVVPEDTHTYRAHYLQVLSGEPIEVVALETKHCIIASVFVHVCANVHRLW